MYHKGKVQTLNSLLPYRFLTLLYVFWSYSKISYSVGLNGLGKRKNACAWRQMNLNEGNMNLNILNMNLRNLLLLNKFL
jgi:hypothetical protein